MSEPVKFRRDKLRCWQCGVEPIDVVDVRTLGDPGPVWMPATWPEGDHEHALHPPTPDDLAARGRVVFDRIMRELLT